MGRAAVPLSPTCCSLLRAQLHPLTTSATKQRGYKLPAAPIRPWQDFEFPRRTVLVLGREREGIPADILALLHHTVEIPQACTSVGIVA